MNYVFYLRSEISSLLLAVATAREAKHLNSSQDTSPYRLRSNLVKFVNLSRRDPHRENVNLNLRRFAYRAKQCRHLKSVVGGGGLKGVGSDFVIQAPSPLTKKQDDFKQSCLFKKCKSATPNLTKPNLVP